MRRVLIITYYFPPSGGPGVQRILKFAKYLPEFGWQPTVLTVRPDRAAYADLDASLAADIPASVKVVRTNAWDPFSLYARLRGVQRQDTIGIGFVKDGGNAGSIQRLGMWLRANVFIPDARIGWVPFAVSAGTKLLRSHEYSAILSSGPPHSVHLAGQRLHRATGVPWVADMRDPWTDVIYNRKLPRTAFARWLDARLEGRALAAANAVVTVSEGCRAGLLQKARMGTCAVVTNGYDPADIGADIGAPRDDDRFVIAHVGTLTAMQHIPALVEALAGLSSEVQFTLRFVGHVDESVLRAYREAGLGDVTETVPYVRHPQAIAHMRSADLLLVSVGTGDDGSVIVPVKAFEYLAVGKPVLAIGPERGDLECMLRRTGGGAYFAFDDIGGMRSFVREQARAAREGLPAKRADESALRAFDRRVLTGRLASILDGLVPDGVQAGQYGADTH